MSIATILKRVATFHHQHQRIIRVNRRPHRTIPFTHRPFGSLPCILGMSQHEVIINRLSEQFTKARDAGDLLFFPSTVHSHEEAGVEVRDRQRLSQDLELTFGSPMQPSSLRFACALPCNRNRGYHHRTLKLTPKSSVQMAIASWSMKEVQGNLTHLHRRISGTYLLAN